MNSVGVMVDVPGGGGTVPSMSVRAPRVDVLLAERPAWRGLLHFWAFLLAIPAGVLLIVFADRPSARVAAAVYAATLLLVFGTSAAYHRLAQTYEQRRIMQRLDHAMIYLLITGTYAPICQSVVGKLPTLVSVNWMRRTSPFNQCAMVVLLVALDAVLRALLLRRFP